MIMTTADIRNSRDLQQGSGRWFMRWAWAAFVALIGLFASVLVSPGSAGDGKTSAQTGPANPERNLPSEKLVSLFDGKSLAGWVEADFAGRGEVKVEEGKIILGMGYMTGIIYTNPIPRMNYEVSLEAMRVQGSDFFCGLTFPVEKDSCSLIVGGWGGGVVGLSNIDEEDAANNETTSYQEFKNGKWYAIRLRVTPQKLEAWIDAKKVVDQETADRRISIRIEMEECVPFGISTWSTTGALRNLRIKRL